MHKAQGRCWPTRFPGFASLWTLWPQTGHMRGRRRDQSLPALHLNFSVQNSMSSGSVQYTSQSNRLRLGGQHLPLATRFSLDTQASVISCFPFNQEPEVGRGLAFVNHSGSTQHLCLGRGSHSGPAWLSGQRDTARLWLQFRYLLPSPQQSLCINVSLLQHNNIWASDRLL